GKGNNRCDAGQCSKGDEWNCSDQPGVPLLRKGIIPCVPTERRDALLRPETSSQSKTSGKCIRASGVSSRASHGHPGDPSRPGSGGRSCRGGCRGGNNREGGVPKGAWPRWGGWGSVGYFWRTR